MNPVTAKKVEVSSEAARSQMNQANDTESYVQAAETQALLTESDFKRITGTINYVGKGTKSFYAYVAGDDGKEYSITENIYSETDHAKEVIQKGNIISFVPKEGKKKPYATDVKVKYPE